MVIKEHEEIESKNNKFNEDWMPPFGDYSNVGYLVDEKALMIRKALNVHIKKG
jgi:hypothetical protein